MRRRFVLRLGIALLVLLAIALATLGIATSYDASCPAPPALQDGTPAMRAVVARCYGGPEVLSVEPVARPSVADNAVLVKVQAASLNPLDWHGMTGTPYIMRLSSGFGTPNDSRVGVDFAGTVEAVGKDVTRFKPGDAVFGGRSGAFAEYVVVPEHRGIAHKPDNLSFEQAATVAIAATTALQGLRDKGQIAPGKRVLINGASGGVGTFAVQIAKALGGEVTGVCSTRNVDLVRSLGADQVIDYTQDDFTRGELRYDLILDLVGNHPLSALREVLAPGGVVVLVTGPKSNPWLGPVSRILKAAALGPFIDERLEPFLAELDPGDLDALARMMADAQVTPVIDREYRLSEIREAMDYLATGRARGKIVIRP
jgi:NADPH:quinone reductase-like Zn-dependent oxidoreductase